jgi:hypothetical protein
MIAPQGERIGSGALLIERYGDSTIVGIHCKRPAPTFCRKRMVIFAPVLIFCRSEV